ncbi:MAG: bifunctional oligoribonuclease/PAP phosphatase NrnA [Eubacteriales bacterium]|nr:bifunctional oligoribonuclease/PAP phosphatase NrnA [Eubacteriales bacterium]MDD4582686.1 bifunctional oligoribonuclease/PAP phosphatase NrnA [Eubacteriales bacterium]
MKNCSLKQIAEILQHGKTILLFPHMQIDGDALGSSVALCRVFRKQGKQAYILIEEQIPGNLAFLDEEYCISDQEMFDEIDICLAVDCSDLARVGKRKDTFFNGKSTISIDHHLTNISFADYNYNDGSAAATGEIVFCLFKEMKSEIDTLTAEALYAAIVTDTGNFQYSNTTKETHLITANLYDHGIDHNKVIVSIYQNIRREKVKIISKVLSTMDFFCNGKGNIAYVSQDMLQETGALIHETEGIVEQLRNINGVEISIFLKEEADTIKVGMRAKTIANVAEIAQYFGGGGHKKAAGCTIKGTLENVKTQIIAVAEDHLKTLER